MEYNRTGPNSLELLYYQRVGQESFGLGTYGDFQSRDAGCVRLRFLPLRLAPIVSGSHVAGARRWEPLKRKEVIGQGI